MKTTIASNIDRVTMEYMRNALVNIYHVSSTAETASDFNDTDYRYNLICDVKKKDIPVLSAFCLGIQYARR